MITLMIRRSSTSSSIFSYQTSAGNALELYPSHAASTLSPGLTLEILLEMVGVVGSA